ncbi:MAG: methyl-accepting chemotaxis protein [Bacteroidota bacterium]|nr:methyl-accepting chemotaxis protein [Bacteroidota bacterium]
MKEKVGLFKKLAHLKISVKLYLLTICFIVGFVLFSIVFSNTMNIVKVQGPIYNRIIQSKDLVADILPPPEYIIESNLVVLQALEEPDSSKIQFFVDRFNKLKSEYDDRHNFWSKDLEEGEMKTLMIQEAYTPAQEFYNVALHDYFPALQAGNKAKAREIANGTLKNLYEQHRIVIDKLVKISIQRASEEESSSLQLMKMRIFYLILIGIIIVVVTCFFCFIIIRQLLGQIGGEPAIIARITREIANGNLHIDFSKYGTRNGIFGAVWDMSDKMKLIIENIFSGAENITHTSEQLSKVSEQLSQGANELASSVQEVSSSTEEMTANLQQKVDNARKTEKVAQSASADVNESSKAVKSSVEGVIDIVKKIEIINDIAFQTNILALNAAVEAARAGEQGKGFAVVATEVRKLAERSKKAADEIDILSRSCVNASEQASYKLINVVPNIEQTSSLVQEIVSSSIEQNGGLNQINNAIQQLNNVAQQSAASAEELSSSAEELVNEVNGLKEAVAYFKIQS